MTETAPLADAQQDLARAYAGGAPGVFVSGVVWLTAGTIWQLHGINAAFAALFIGGMAIHPLASLIERSVFGGPKATTGKALETLAIEATIPLFIGVLIAWVLLVRAPDLAIPTFAAIIGARYFLFRSMYGEIAYWALGGAILLIAAVALFGLRLPVNIGFLVGAVELVAAALILRRWRGRP